MLYALLIIALVFVDMLTKKLAVLFLAPIETFPLIANVFHLTYRENTGAAFSVLEGKMVFLVVLTAIAIFAMLYYIFFGKEKSGLIRFSLTLLCAGGIGNLVDRLTLGYVIDFFDFRLINFAVFNVADVLVTCGAVLLCIAILKTGTKKHG